MQSFHFRCRNSQRLMVLLPFRKHFASSHYYIRIYRKRKEEEKVWASPSLPPSLSLSLSLSPSLSVDLSVYYVARSFAARSLPSTCTCVATAAAAAASLRAPRACVRPEIVSRFDGRGAVGRSRFAASTITTLLQIQA